MPWVIIDYKGADGDVINRIPYIREIGYNDKLKHPGVHILHAHPGDDDHMEPFLWRIWENGHTGVYVDEAYMLPNAAPASRKGAYISILTQGRSKRIPVITLTQRPRHMTQFHFTEADYHSIFHLQDTKDRSRVMEYVPQDLEKRLPEYHSWYHRVKDQTTFGLYPSPDEATILSRFETRLKPNRRFL